MTPIKLYRFEDPETGTSKFGSYYLGRLPGPTEWRAQGATQDVTLTTAWRELDAHGGREAHKPWKFAYVSLRQAERYMRVEEAIEAGHLSVVEVEPGHAILCETQAIFNEYGVCNVYPYSPNTPS